MQGDPLPRLTGEGNVQGGGFECRRSGVKGDPLPWLAGAGYGKAGGFVCRHLGCGRLPCMPSRLSCGILRRTAAVLADAAVAAGWL